MGARHIFVGPALTRTEMPSCTRVLVGSIAYEPPSGLHHNSASFNSPLKNVWQIAHGCMRGLERCRNTGWRYCLRGSQYSLWADGAGLDPGARQVSQSLLRTRRGIATLPWVPSPRNKIVVRKMVMQEFKVAPAVSLRILELLAYLRNCFSLPGHLDRR